MVKTVWDRFSLSQTVLYCIKQYCIVHTSIVSHTILVCDRQQDRQTTRQDICRG